MDVLIENAMDEPCHVAVVRSGRSLHFVISPEPVPVPSGAVQGRYDLDPGQALSLAGIDDRLLVSAGIEGYGCTVRATLREGAADGVRHFRFSLLGRKTGE